MPRSTSPAAVRIYTAARRFVDNALRADDSLFTPGTAIWAAPVLDDLYRRFVEHPDEGSTTFEVKLRRQLRGESLDPPRDAPPETYQLAGELLYVHLLPASGIYGNTKRRIIGQPLGWSPAPVSIPADLDAALDAGLVKAGMPFKTGRFFQLAFLLNAVREWKQLPAAEREKNLVDPWAFKRWLFKLPITVAYAQREILLHLIFPDTFEPITSRDDKAQIAAAFASLADPEVRDLDQRLAQIRAALTPEYGVGFNFYDPQLQLLWKGTEPPAADDASDLYGSDQGVTGAAAGLSGSEQIRIALAEIVAQGGTATMRQIAEAVERRLGDKKLSAQGLASLRFFVNRVAVQKGYIQPYDPGNPGWRITPAGRELLAEQPASGAPGSGQLPQALGAALRPYVDLVTHLVAPAYTPEALRNVLVETVPPIAPGVRLPTPEHLVADLMRLRLLEPLDDGQYRRWPHLGDATPDLLLKYAALTVLAPAGDDEYDLPALRAPFDALPHPPDAWPLGEPLLRWYEEARLVRRNPDGTWQSYPDVLDPLNDDRPTARALNTFLANLRRAREAPADLPALTDAPLPVLPTAVLEARIAEIQRELLIDRETILRVYRSLIAGHHVILSGPPGTGKTHLARILPRMLWRDEQETVRLTMPNDPALAPTEPPLEEPLRREGYLVEIVTATEDWGVRHVIGGIAPRIERNDNGSTLVYSVSHGCLTRAVLANYQFDGDLPAEPVALPRREPVDGAENRYRGLWLVIDEFTRAQIDSAFGGLLTTLSGQRGPTLSFPTDAGERVVPLPRDFRLIGTLNSFDRHFLNQISEAMKRRFAFIDVLPPGRERRDEEQAMAIYRALSALAEQGVPGFRAEGESGRAGWTAGLSVRRAEQPGENGLTVRYVVAWPDDPAARDAFAGLWRIFEAARVYRQLGTAQAEATYRTLFAGRAAGFDWPQALDSALADTLADQLQVIARDELRAILALLEHPDDTGALRDAIVAILNRLSAPRQSAHLLQLRMIDPRVDPNQPSMLTTEQVAAIFGSPAALPITATGLFARRLAAFVNEQGL